MQLSEISILLLQVLLILVLSRLMGMLAAWVHQPKVVGEMLAGIMLGPSLLGLLAPGLASTFFPPQSMGLLNVLAQVGVVFFLFLIGLHLDSGLIRGHGRDAVLISHASIVVPFSLGAILVWALYEPLFSQAPQSRFLPVALFMGAAMSVTAFPVLARILTERNLHKTKVGTIAIACAAVDDVMAWCILAFVVAIGKTQGLTPALNTAALAVAYVLVMWFVVRPLLRRIQAFYERRGGSAQMVLAFVLAMTLVSAVTTDWIGIHALFGAFFMGAMMPREPRFIRLITDRLEDFTVIFLLPVFFAYAGLRTQIGLLDSAYLWGITGLIVAVACIGKFGGATLVGRASGLPWREASAIGILMNTRGLMELVILTIGLQMGVISDSVFAMMVIMALLTTAMTTPILHWVYPTRMFEATPVDEQTAASEFGVLVPVSRPESSAGLARIVAALGPTDGHAKLYGLTLQHPIPPDALGMNVEPDDPSRQQATILLLEEAQRLSIPAEMMSFVSRDIPSDIARVARSKRVDLVLMGFHKPIFGQTILGGTVHRVLTGTDADVAILVDRGIAPTFSILVPYQGSQHDRLAMDLARRMSASPGITVTILHVVSPDRKLGAEGIRKQQFPGSVSVWLVEEPSPIVAVLKQAGHFDLVVVGLGEEWGLESHLFGLRVERIARDWPGSLLLVRKYIPLSV